MEFLEAPVGVIPKTLVRWHNNTKGASWVIPKRPVGIIPKRPVGVIPKRLVGYHTKYQRG